MKTILIYELISKYRRDNNISQMEFGKMLGVSPQAVSKWENRVCLPDTALLPEIADIIGVLVDDFFKDI